MQLVLNGKKMNCPCDHLEDLKAAYGSGQEIIIVNGFATTENLKTQAQAPRQTS